MTTQPYTKITLRDAAARSLIGDLLFEHLFDLVDWQRLQDLERIIEQRFLESLDEDRLRQPSALNDVRELVAGIVGDAWQRLLLDGRRAFMEEVKFDDEECELCHPTVPKQQRSPPS